MSVLQSISYVEKDIKNLKHINRVYDTIENQAHLCKKVKKRRCYSKVLLLYTQLK